MNCSVRTCTARAEVHEPLPLCRTDALRVIAAYAQMNLRGSSRTTQVRHDDAQAEIANLYRLLDADALHALAEQ